MLNDETEIAGGGEVLILYRPASATHPAPVLVANKQGLIVMARTIIDLLDAARSGLAKSVINGDAAMQICFMETAEIKKLFAPREPEEAEIN
jgi:hypothetical protein